MKMLVYMAAFLCVLGLAVGQILFKASATMLSQAETIFSYKVAAAFLGAVCLYGITSIAWVWVLQKMELGRVYPIMAMAFILVPIGSHFIFGEKFTSQYFFGVFVIAAGIYITTKA